MNINKSFLIHELVSVPLEVHPKYSHYDFTEDDIRYIFKKNVIDDKYDELNESDRHDI